MITYDLAADWARFLGGYRVYGGAIKVGYTDLAASLGHTSITANYRFGQTQSLGSATAATVVGGGNIVLEETGVRSGASGGSGPPTSTSYACLKLGGAINNYTMLASAPMEVLQSTFACWTKYPPLPPAGTASTGCICGYQFQYVVWQGSTPQVATQGTFALHLSTLTTGATQLVVHLPDAVSTMTLNLPAWAAAAGWHHIAVVAYATGVVANYQVRFRCFVDSRYAGDFQCGVADYYLAPQPFWIGPNDAPFPPTLLAYAAGGNPAANPENGWVTPQIGDGYLGSVDEVTFAWDHPSPLNYTDDLTAAPAPWQVGDQVLPTITRHADPHSVGYDDPSFIFTGPVENLGSSGAINQVQATMVDTPVILEPGFNNPALVGYEGWDTFYTFDQTLVPLRCGLPNPAAFAAGTPTWTAARQGQALVMNNGLSLWSDVAASNTGTLAMWVKGSGASQQGNLAAYGTALQSSTPDPAYGAAQALNLDCTTGYAQTSSETNPWWQVGLARAGTITAVYIYPEPALASLWLNDYYVLVSPVPFVSGNLAACLAQSGVWSVHRTGDTLGASGYVTVTVPSVAGSYVRIQSNRNPTSLSVREVEVLGWDGFAWDGVNWQESRSRTCAALCSANGPTINLGLSSYSGDIVCAVRKASGTLTGIRSGVTLAANTWYHIAVTWSMAAGGTVNLWVGGLLQGSVTGCGDLTTVPFNRLYLGGVSPHQSYYGTYGMTTCDDVGYIPQELPSAAITALATTGVTYTAQANTVDLNNRMQVSVRADPGAFAPDATIPAWSNWYTLRDGWSQTIGSGGIGQYVQARVRLWPSADAQALTSPGLASLQLTPVFAQPLLDGQADLPAQIFVWNFHRNLPAQIAVRGTASADLPCSVCATYHVRTADLAGSVSVRTTGDLQGSLQVHEWRNLPAAITVPPTSYAATRDLGCQIAVHRNDANLPCSLLVWSRVNVPCTVTVPVHLLPCTVRVQQHLSQNLPCRIMVPQDVPGAVPNLVTDLPQQTWQRQNHVVCTWGEAAHRVDALTGYYYRLATRPSAANTAWNSTTSLGATVTIPTAGQWYFSVAARNVKGVFGPVTTCQVWYNRLPAVPGADFMQINGDDTQLLRPLVARFPGGSGHALTWSAAGDLDTRDALTYEIQIATQDDFGPNPVNGQSSIVQTLQISGDTTANWASVGESGLHFWRIRASDGKESSDWSRVGSFVVNVPPTRPQGLAARQR